jgi:arylsulfate sulfotransferase
MKKYLFIAAIVITISGCKKDKYSKASGDPGTVNVVLPKLNIPADSIKLNPYGYAPLSALLKFTSPNVGRTKIIVKGQDSTASDITQVFDDKGLTHIVPILGLYPDYNNNVEVYLVDDNGNDIAKTTLTVQTEPLPSAMPNYMHVDVADYGNMEPGLNLVSNLSSYPVFPVYPYIVDNFGKIRWYLDFGKSTELNKLFYDCGISRLQNGNYYFADRSSGHIYEIDVMGRTIHKWSFPGYDFHHNVTEMPNGNFLITVDKQGSVNSQNVKTIEDYVLEIDRNSNQILNEWDLKKSLNTYRRTLSADAQDWIHVNAVIYDPTDNTIIVSGRVQGVVKLSFDNQVKWILAPHKDWGLNGRGEDLNKFLLAPLDANGNKITDDNILQGNSNAPDFEWCWYQHSPILMPNNDLMVFDNGSTRNYNDNQTHYSRAVQYKIDPLKMTIKQIWDYGKERGRDTYSMIISSVKYLPEKNHILFSPGFNVTNAVGNGGKIVEIDYATKKVVFQMSVSAASTFAWHRVQRLALYPNNKSFIP